LYLFFYTIYKFTGNLEITQHSEKNKGGPDLSDPGPHHAGPAQIWCEGARDGGRLNPIVGQDGQSARGTEPVRGGYGRSI
jgi:hypothetical protein